VFRCVCGWDVVVDVLLGELLEFPGWDLVVVLVG